MQRRRIEFLPAFFAILGVAFAIALYLRIRSYDSAPQPGDRAAIGRTGTVRSGTGGVVLMPPGTMTIVEGSPAAMRPNASGPAGIADPLLRVEMDEAPQPLTRVQPPQPQQQAPKPSFVSRIVQPIVKALGGGSRTENPSTSQKVSSRPSTVESSSSAQPSRGGSDSTTTNPRTDDKTSDNVPPQLLHVEFIPPQVRDGEETTLVVQAYDELSGVRSVSGTIAAPSGAVQGFACQREPETNRFVSRITIPKDAAEGIWRVNYLSMIDNASNAATFTGQQGLLPVTSTFRVTSSRPDAQGPTLLAVWMDRRSIKAGEKNIIHVTAEDDKSGVNLVSGVFQSPSKFARVGFVCRVASGNGWDCEFNSPACSDCGDWQLEQVQLQDKANNMTTLRMDNQLVAGIRMDISADHCDSTPPALQTLMLDRPVVSNAEESVITATATLSDDVCGILNVSGQATGPAAAGGVPPRLYFSFAAVGESRTWSGRITIPRLAAKGAWRITWIQVLDRGHNLKTYSQSDPALAGVGFTVQ